MAIELANLPYALNALEPLISAETLDYHYHKHHATYVNKLNAAIEGTEYENQSLEGIIWSATGGIFNNAAQVWNHSFYWHCLSPFGGDEPKGKLATAIATKWGSYDDFKQQFTAQALANFGSGWTWLVARSNGEVEILNTDDADTPIAKEEYTPLLTIDVWEHAYYIDYRNARPKYLEAFWKLVYWSFAEENYQQCLTN